jgi:hypothetical protein
LVIIRSDPRSSHRPAEAVRVAAGVGAWERVEVAVYLWGPAALALAAPPEGLVDEENFNLYLPLLQHTGRRLYVQAGAPELARLAGTPGRFEPLDLSPLAALAARSKWVCVF